MIFRTIFRQL